MATSLDKEPAAPPLSRHALRPPVEPLDPPPTEREQFWNLPNTITMGRAAAVPS